MRVYGVALRRAYAGQSGVLHLVGEGGDPVGRMDAAHWTAGPRAGDESLVDRCDGATLDVGCGPGRLVAALARAGRPVLGIDVSAEAVRQTRRRGVPAIRGDIFDPLPMEGGWRSLLLADGNIGIGGDPRRLLRRCAEVLERGGRVVAEVHPPDGPTWAGPVTLRHGDRESDPFPWACVAVGDVAETVRRTGLTVTDEWTEAGRWFVELTR
jgi:SAM-dependent methyltransferase